MSKQIVLITGAAGFLGTYLSNICFSEGFNVLGISRNVPRNIQVFKNFFANDCSIFDYDLLLKEYSPSFIFHLAGSASVPFSVLHPEDDFGSLLPATARLLAAVGRFEGKKPKVVLISSAAIYGNPKQLPISESDAPSPMSPYGVHKLLAEVMLQQYGSLYKFPSAALRVFSAYGPGLRKQLIWDVCVRLLKASSESKTSIEFFGTGNETRDFIHAHDVARAALLVAKSPADGHHCYNIGSGIETTVKSVCQQLSASLSRPCPHSFNHVVRDGDPLFWRCDNTKLAALSFSPAITLDEGLKQTADWVRSEFNS